MYKKLTIHKESGNYCIDNSLLISCLSNDYNLRLLNKGFNDEIGVIYANGNESSRNSFYYPGTERQEKIFNSFINNHVKIINNSVHLINVIIDGVKVDKVNVLNLYNDKIQKTFYIEVWDGVYPFNDIIKKFNIDANNLQDCIKKIDAMKKYKEYKITIIYNDYIKANRYKNKWNILKNVD